MPNKRLEVALFTAITLVLSSCMSAQSGAPVAPSTSAPPVTGQTSNAGASLLRATIAGVSRSGDGTATFKLERIIEKPDAQRLDGASVLVGADVPVFKNSIKVDVTAFRDDQEVEMAIAAISGSSPPQITAAKVLILKD